MYPRGTVVILVFLLQGSRMKAGALVQKHSSAAVKCAVVCLTCPSLIHCRTQTDLTSLTHTKCTPGFQCFLWRFDRSPTHLAAWGLQNAQGNLCMPSPRVSCMHVRTYVVYMTSLIDSWKEILSSFYDKKMEYYSSAYWQVRRYTLPLLIISSRFSSIHLLLRTGPMQVCTTGVPFL